MKRLRLAAAVATLGLMTAPQAVAQQPVTLKVAIVQQVDSLNPFLSIFQAGTEVGRLMYDYLTAYDQKDQHTVEGIASTWESSPDKLTWTFTIPDGKKWTDGKPITSRDVAFTYNLMLSNEVARTANGSFVTNFESVTAPDERTLVIKTKQPQVTMLALDIPIVPEHIWSSVTDLKTYANDTMPVVGSGPFVLTEYRAGEFIKFKANRNYWRGTPKYDELHFVYFKNADAAVQALSKGEIDLVNRMGPAHFNSLKDKPGITLNKAQGTRFNELLLNPGAATRTGQPIGDGHPALRDVKVRQAIAKAIDINTIIDRVNGGYAEPGTGLIPPVFTKYHWKADAGTLRKFNPAEAAANLDTAGYPKGADGIRVGPDSKPLKLRLLGHTGRAYDEQTSEFVKRSLADIGISVDVQLVSDNQVNESTTAANYDLAFSGWTTNVDPDFILSLHTCAQRPGPDGTGGTTDSFFCDETYDQLYARQLAEFDEAKRVELVKQMQQRFYDQAPSVVLGYDNALEAYRDDRFARFPVQPDPGGVIMAQNGVWGYYGATPASARNATSSEVSPAVIGIAAAGAVVLAGAAWLAARRRTATAGERE